MIKHALLVLLTLLSMSLYASEDWAHVELIVFEQATKQRLMTEHWPVAEKPIYDPSSIVLARSDKVQFHYVSSSLPAYQALPSNTLTLHRVVDKLLKSKQRHVLNHLAWQQPLNTSSKPVLIDAIAHNSNLLKGITGSIELVQKQSLELAVALNINVDPQHKLQHQSKPLNSVVPVSDIDTTSQMSQWIQWEHNQRVELDKLHYIDHPLVGIIMIVKPVEPTLLQNPIVDDTLIEQGN